MAEQGRINKAIKLIAQLSIDRSSQVFSKLIKTGASITMENAYIADISNLTGRINENDEPVVGAFIDLVGDAPFKFLFYVRIEDSFILTDLMLRRSAGSTKSLDIYASSAVQEIGNIIASAISNVFSTDFQIGMKPTPPVVVSDYAGTIFQEYIMSAATQKNEILLIESKFQVLKNNVKCHLFILPIGNSEKVLSYIASTM